ncbi:MAG: hypothetical protein FWG47_05495 [Propionibacteriaceae bacterium]|nr:hypothetical protein [Propionibacteriaceae bacterium]
MSESRSTLAPALLRPSLYGVAPDKVAMRAAQVPGMTSRLTTDLFPDSTPLIYPALNGKNNVLEATRKALEAVNLDQVEQNDTINVVVSHSPLAMMNGEPMTAALKAIREVLLERTPCRQVRLRVTGGSRFREQAELITHLGLDKIFEGKAKPVAALDRGVAIDTEIGRLWGLHKVYDSTWLFHVHTSDLREVHFHRMLDRALKPFGMAYARGETRSAFHMSMGPRSAMFICRAIFQSEFVQRRYLASCFLLVSPGGVAEVVAGNDLNQLGERVTASALQEFGKMIQLMGEIDSCVAVLDAPMPVIYCTAAAIAYAAFASAREDVLDLDVALPAFSTLSESLLNHGGNPLAPIPPIHPGLRACVQNYAWRGSPFSTLPKLIPTQVVGKEQVEMFAGDSQNISYMKHARPAESLTQAIATACAEAETDKILVFDNAIGGLNCSQSMAEYLDALAPAVSAKVDRDLMPRWLSQRGIAPKV